MIINWGDAPFKAYIKVTYPRGKCTVTLGNESYSHSGGGTVTFKVKHKGTWTVKIVNSNATKSTTTSISKLNQVQSLSLDYRYDIFKAGTGAIVSLTLAENDNASITMTSSSIVQSHWANTSRTSYLAKAQTKSKLNLSGYTKFCISANCTSVYGSAPLYLMAGSSAFSLDSADDYYSTGVVAKAKLTTGSTTFSLDISSLSSSYYVGTCGGGKITIYDMWLE